MAINLSISNLRQIAGATAATINNQYNSVEEYLQNIIERACNSYADQYAVDRITSSDFIFRFTDEERSTILASNDPNIINFIHRIKDSPFVWLDSDEVKFGLNYLVGVNLLSDERKLMINEYSSPLIVDTKDNEYSSPLIVDTEDNGDL